MISTKSTHYDRDAFMDQRGTFREKMVASFTALDESFDRIDGRLAACETVLDRMIGHLDELSTEVSGFLSDVLLLLKEKEAFLRETCTATMSIGDLAARQEFYDDIAALRKRIAGRKNIPMNGHHQLDLG
jgi:hypothetical protein